MARLLILFVILLTFANAEYFIKFGSFKNLQGLERHIENLPKSLRSHVVIVHSNGWYIPFAYYTSNKNILYSKVSYYKRYFKDAHIAHSNMLKYPLVRNYANRVSAKRRTYTPPIKQYRQVQTYRPIKPYTSSSQNVAISESDYTMPFLMTKPRTQRVEQNVKTTTIVPPIVEPDDFGVVEYKQYKSFNKKMLSGHHYYLAYKGKDKSPNLLIKVSFNSDEVTYQPIIGDMQMTKAKYLVDGDRLYMFANSFTKEGAYSKLEEHRDNHFLVSSWSNGKKLNTLRYYYRLNDAKEYLGVETSKGLSSTLEEGDFADSFWNRYR